MNFELMKDLCEVFGVSGREQTTAQLIKDKMENICDEMVTDLTGNLYCTKKSSQNNTHTVMLDAHMDSIGLIVKEILKDGFIKFEAIGGVDTRILPGSEVVIHGKKSITGIVASKPPHLLSKEEAKEVIPIDKMFIDTGYKEDTIFELVEVGDVISFVQQADIIGKCITATYLDDRAGVAGIIEIFEKLKNVSLPYNLVGAFSTQEELGLKGAKIGSVSPDIAIVIDVTHGCTPDEKGDRVYKVGGGSAIGMGPNVHPKLYEMMVKKAEENNLCYQTEVMEGNTGTNAWAYQVSGLGIPCLIMSFPIKFMHTPVETLQISDFDNFVQLTYSFLKDLTVDSILDISEMKVIKGE